MVQQRSFVKETGRYHGETKALEPRVESGLYAVVMGEMNECKVLERHLESYIKTLY